MKKFLNIFMYHTPKNDQSARYEKIRSKARELAELIDESCPESEDKNIAIERLRECVMWANASIAINEKVTKLIGGN